MLHAQCCVGTAWLPGPVPGTGALRARLAKGTRDISGPDHALAQGLAAVFGVGHPVGFSVNILCATVCSRSDTGARGPDIAVIPEECAVMCTVFCKPP